MKSPLLLALGWVAAATFTLVPAPTWAGEKAKFALQRSAAARAIRDRIDKAAPDADDQYLANALAAVSTVERERFVPARLRSQSYDDLPLPIGHDQTISSAYIVAVMTAAAHIPPEANVLDVGTGSGYQAATLSPLSRHVWSIEIVEPLAKSAAARLRHLGYHNVTVRAGDGFAGWPEQAPFDAIVVAAGAAKVPQPLIDQLKVGGLIVMPIGPSWAQEQLLVIEKQSDGSTRSCSLGWTMFVPLTGRGQRGPRAPGLTDVDTPLCYSGSIAAVSFEARKPRFEKPSAARLSD